MAFNKKQLKEQLDAMERQAELQKQLNESAATYAKHMLKISELQKNISHIQEQLNDEKEAERELTDELAKSLKNIHKLDEAGLRILIKQRNAIKEKRQALRNNTQVIEAELKALKKTNEEWVEAAKGVSRVNLGLKEGLKFLKKTPGLIKKGFGKLKGFGVFDMDKSIRMAGVEMGKMVDVSSAFGKDIVKASNETMSMGIHVKDLAKMQSSYSAELGRSVMLSQEGFEAISQMAAGTILGAEGAASLAAEMDSFNISAEATGEIIEDVTNMSEKMGLNAGKVIKTLQNNLKMANKYHFKGGVQGMVKMAAQAAKFNMSMETTASFADKLFDIEGAVEMSAKLNTMGGEWSKLGDPMKLMFQARNDMEGLQTSIIDATSGMADFNKETGEFSFSGLELHRMKELEKITGIAAEEMAEMAKSKAKFAKISGQMGIDVGADPEMKEFIENGAVFNDKTKQFELKLSGYEKAIPVKELSETHKKMMIADAASLKERAENSQSFDDELTNMLENAKTLLLPLLKGLNDSIKPMIKAFKGFMKSDMADKIREAASMIGDVVGSAIKLFLEFPRTFGAIALILLTPAKWILNGLALARGFMMGSKGFGAMGAMGAAGYGTPGGPIGPAQATTKKKGGMKTRSGKGGMGVGIGGMLGGMALDYGRSTLDNPNSSGGKALGVASGALSGAGTGAMIGSVIPVVGTAIGAIIGGLVGGIWSAVEEYGGPASGGSGYSAASQPPVNDAILANGKVTPIDSKDQVFQVSKPGGAFDKSNSSALGTKSSSSGKVHISFDTITVKSDGNVGKIDLENDTAFMQMLATKIKEALSKSANGGVLSPNPS